MRTIPVLLLLLAARAYGASVWTGQYNNSRDNANIAETVLTQANVIAGQFGRLGSFSVDGAVYAQPLIIDNVSIQGATAVAVIATMHDSVYLFDANVPNKAYLWKTALDTSRTSYPGQNNNNNNFFDLEVGCLSTPVVDVAAAVVYVVCTNSLGTWKLYALNLSDGTTFHAATTIAGVAGGVTFDGAQHLQRPALLLSAGLIYIAFGSYADIIPYQGWVFSYNATTLAQAAIWLASTTTSVEGAGIWMGGGGPPVDASGNIYVMTGNGPWDGASNFGESFIKLNSSLILQDYFTPSDWALLNSNDTDLGSGRPLLFSTLVMGGGKRGPWWVLNQGSMGGLQGSGGTPAQTWQIGSSGNLNGNYGGLAYANSTLYVGMKGDKVYAYTFDGSTFNTTALASTVSTFAHPGAMLAYTSNANASGSGLLWAVTDASSSAVTERPATLRAFHPTTLVEIYNSGTKSSDALGTIAKFAAPTVVNGKVYVSVLDNAVEVYGQLPSAQMRNTTLRGTAVLR